MRARLELFGNIGGINLISFDDRVLGRSRNISGFYDIGISSKIFERPNCRVSTAPTFVTDAYLVILIVLSHVGR